MMVVPYRAKNPPERFPICTLLLIAANIIAYAATTEYFLYVREPVLHVLAFSHNHINLVRMLTALFLHGNPLHLLGNILFLWIFGAAVEGRLGPIRFLILYFGSGIVGDLLQDAIMGPGNPTQWNLGASGAIMGLAGAYLYMFPFAQVRVLWAYNLKIQAVDWGPEWVFLYFIAFDVIDGMIYEGMDGVGYLAHLGGALCGFVFAVLLHAQRDSEEASAAQAMRSDAGGDYSILALHELEALIENKPGDVGLIIQFCQRAQTRPGLAGPERCLEMLETHENVLIEHADPDVIAYLALSLATTVGRLPSSFFTRLGAKLEVRGSEKRAFECYDRVVRFDPESPDVPQALIRIARLSERLDTDKSKAAGYCAELLDRFPHSSQAQYAAIALRRLDVEPAMMMLPREDPRRKRVEVVAPVEEPEWPLLEPEPAPAAEESNGLAPLTPGTMPTLPIPSKPQEAAYEIGDTSGAVLRPIGRPVSDGAG